MSGDRQAFRAASRGHVGGTLFARVAGYLRDMVLAQRFGAGDVMDVWALANVVALRARQAVSSGLMEGAFVPALRARGEAEGDVPQTRLAAGIFVALAPWLLIGGVGLWFAAPAMVGLLAPEFTARGLVEPAVWAVRAMALVAAGLAVGGVLQALLRSRERMFPAAAAPVASSLVVIGAVLLSPPQSGLLALVVGALVGAWLQAVAQGRALAADGLRWPGLRSDPGAAVALRALAPQATVFAIVTARMLVNRHLAAEAGPGGLAHYHFALRLAQLPHALMGVGFAVAIFPILSGHLRAGRDESARKALWDATERVARWLFPAAAVLHLLALPGTRLLWERGAFGLADSVETAQVLAAYAAPLPLMGLAAVWVRGWFGAGEFKALVPVTAVTAPFGAGMAWLIFHEAGRLGLPTPLMAIPLGGAAAAALRAAILWLRRPAALAGRPRWSGVLGPAALALGLWAAFVAVLPLLGLGWGEPAAPRWPMAASAAGVAAAYAALYAAGTWGLRRAGA